MKTRSLFPGEVSVYIIPHQAAAGVEISVVFPHVVAQTCRHSIKVESAHLTDTHRLSSGLAGEMGRKTQTLMV